MALPSMSVVCAFAGAYAAREKSQAILGKLIWSEEPASGVATTNVAPAFSDASGQAIFRIRASADSWVSVGKVPNAGTSPRFPVAANTDYDVFADAGDKLAWVAA